MFLFKWASILSIVNIILTRNFYSLGLGQFTIQMIQKENSTSCQGAI